MGKINWYVNRLRAMNAKEIWWRLNQKRIQKKEKQDFGKRRISVCQNLFYPQTSNFSFNEDKLGINFNNQKYQLNTTIHLLGLFDYEKYKTKWHSGFQTEKEWPLTFSYNLNYKQRDDIGDARTNWELNRHFQFILLAKSYYVTADKSYLNELKRLWEDWNYNNPFLYGISWTSVMEIAIRSISWMFMLSFLKKSNANEKDFLEKIECGILNMTGYIVQHYSRYSSANNHLIVEATAIGLAGFCFNHSTWKNLSIKILSDELYLQNYKDGVNKELSLHYQSFVMEAYALMIHCLQINGKVIPEEWKDMLSKMSEFVAHCLCREGTACEFGDNDEGKILDLQGGDIHHYNYVLQLCSLVLHKRYDSFENIHENIYWLFSNKVIDEIKHLPIYDNTPSRCFPIGGNSLLRDHNNNILIGIDHAALGFGSIAAHGHADALSFQLFIKGIPVFVDPGTYIYHCNLGARNEFRKTINHNTVCIQQHDQSEMLGAFLWGKKANCTLESYSSDTDKEILIATHDGYRPYIHRRAFVWNKINLTLEITDSINQHADWCTTYIVNSNCTIHQADKNLHIFLNNEEICMLQILSPHTDINSIRIEKTEISPRYGICKPTHAIRIYGNTKELKTLIKINKNI